jgi:hypothetical protein
VLIREVGKARLETIAFTGKHVYRGVTYAITPLEFLLFRVPLLIRFVARASEKGFPKVGEDALFGVASGST